jgi:hypothetical protein
MITTAAENFAIGEAVDSRDVGTIDRELELLTAVAAAIRRLGGAPSTALIDELLEERLTRTDHQPRHRALV